MNYFTSANKIAKAGMCETKKKTSAIEEKTFFFAKELSNISSKATNIPISRQSFISKLPKLHSPLVKLNNVHMQRFRWKEYAKSKKHKISATLNNLAIQEVCNGFKKTLNPNTHQIPCNHH